MGLFRRRDTNPAQPILSHSAEALPQQLAWLADAPMFIDGARVDAFYDAIFRPDYGEISRTLGQTVSRDTTLGGDAKLGSLLPGLFAKADLGIHADHSRGRERSQETEVEPI